MIVMSHTNQEAETIKEICGEDVKGMVFLYVGDVLITMDYDDAFNLECLLGNLRVEHHLEEENEYTSA